MAQVLPYLKSFKTKAESEDYLKSLIGQGAKQDDFIRRYSDRVFRTSRTMTKNLDNSSAFPSLQSVHTTSSSSGPVPSSRNDFPFKTRGAKLKQTPNLQTDSNIEVKQTIDPKIYQNFGNSANVYIKNRDSEDRAEKNSKKKKAKPITSGSVTPEPKPEPKPEPIQGIGPPQPEDKMPLTNSKFGLPADVDIPVSEISPPSLKEILQLKMILESFESEKSTPKGTGKCFCQARSHELPIGRLPKQCTNCGLIYCRLKPALGACPSCGEFGGLSRNVELKESIRSEFITKMDLLIKSEIEKYQKRLTLEQQREALAQEAERVYPSLPTQASSVNHKANRTQPSVNASYSSQLGGGLSIQNQIKLGYEKLAKQFDEGSNKQSSSEGASKASSKSNSSHTFLRLNSNNGKTKIITVTKKKLDDDNDRKTNQLNQLFDHNFLDNDDAQNTPYTDEFDDLLRISSNLNPSLFVEKPSELKCPDYVPIGVYHVQ